MEIQRVPQSESSSAVSTRIVGVPFCYQVAFILILIFKSKPVIWATR